VLSLDHEPHPQVSEKNDQFSALRLFIPGKIIQKSEFFKAGEPAQTCAPALLFFKNN
jgi:hypothetical protein